MSTRDILESSIVLVLILGLLGGILWQRKQAGRLVFILDRDWLIPLLSGIVSAMFIYRYSYPINTIQDVMAIIVWCAFWILIFLGSSIEMRENGIRHNYSLIRWSSIAAYRWEENPPVTLVVNLRDKASSQKQKTYQISAHYKDFVDQELKQRVMAKEELK